MPLSAVRSFTDPDQYRTFLRAADVETVITAPGAYRSELTRIDLHKLWMQRGRTSLPMVERGAITADRCIIGYLAGADHPPTTFGGMEVEWGDIVFIALRAEYYHRASTESHWASMSLAPGDLAAAARALAGHDLTAPVATRLLRPPPHLMTRLKHLHDAASNLAATAPEILAHPEVARAMEQELIRVMVGCLTHEQTAEVRASRHQRVPVMRRFEEVLEASQDNPLYLTELCARIGVADRTLRLHCLEQLGISPHRYLWLRRMNLARRALARANPEKETVTGIAMNHGFGELGRFSVSYRRLFGEPPSATLRAHAAVTGLEYPAPRQ